MDPLHRAADLLGVPPQRLAKPERKQREEDPRDRGEEEGAAPAEFLGDVSAACKSDGDAERAPGAPDRHGPAALFLGEVVGEQRGAGGVVSGLTNPEDGAAHEQLRKAASETGEEGGEAPDGDARRDHGLADAAIRPEAERHGGHGVDEQKGRAEKSDLGVAQVELFLDQRRGRGADVAIHVIEEVDADHDGEDVTGIASRHGGIL